MAASGDVTIAQDGSPAKLHPYLVAFVRWCVSCLWSTTTVLLHRLLTSHLPPIAAVVAPRSKPSRPAGKEHLHPEPRVECQVLHQPTQHEFDVIFVHGLYGSLCNTWRQGEWRTKYPKTPEKVHLRRPSETPTPCFCHQCSNDVQENGYNKTKNKNNINKFNRNKENQCNKGILNEYSDSESKSSNFGYRNNNFHNENNSHNFENRNNDFHDENHSNNYGNENNNFHKENKSNNYENGNNHFHKENKINNYENGKNNFHEEFMSNNFENGNNNFHKENKSNNYENGNNNCHKLFPFNADIEENNAFTNINEQLYSDFTKILPQDEVFITENFYNNALMNHIQVIDNYETQAQFVSDLFKHCDNDCDLELRNKNNEYFDSENKNNNVENRNNNVESYLLNNDVENRNNTVENGNNIVENGNSNNENGNNNGENENNNNENGNNNEENGNNNNKYECKCKEKCEVGCGCICDDCYSLCWPRDWIRVDFPNARVISVNYTSDPHLWRPLWIKESKRLCLHERASQMAHQLLDLGVGRRPVVWVGHSKGGLFIKQIYCEGYDAYLKLHPDQNKDTKCTERIVNQCSITTENENHNAKNRKNYGKNNNNNGRNDNNKFNNNGNINNNTEKNDNSARIQNCFEDCVKSSKYVEENPTTLRRQASIWQNSVAFMFYSVPHRGSPLADIKTPVTARSVELIEISKDNSLVLSLQERWVRASAAPFAAPAPLVRSIVETRRTLMAVLWLRIVSADSADPGIGALCGVSVDHREICKPSSRRCLLYTELTTLIRVALLKHAKVT